MLGFNSKTKENNFECGGLINIRIDHTMRIIPSYAEWQNEYRSRIIHDMEKHINETENWFSVVSHITTCPDCFCPNLQSFNAYPYANEKGFVCPVCANRFTSISVVDK